MAPHEEVEYVLADCFFAVGQSVGLAKRLDHEAVAWWRSRYREKFLRVMTVAGNSWARDRRRVTAVGRFLGQRAVRHAGGEPVITRQCAATASADVESGCRLNAEREGLPPRDLGLATGPCARGATHRSYGRLPRGGPRRSRPPRASDRRRSKKPEGRAT